MNKPTFRPYTPADKDLCLAIFDSNIPTYFAETERTGYEAFLDAPTGPYFILEQGSNAVGCAGYGKKVTDPDDYAIFSYGMVAREFHKQGYGTHLAQLRLDAMHQDPAVKAAKLNTSQLTAPFYARFGFKTVNIIKDGFADGLDDVEMHLIF